MRVLKCAEEINREIDSCPDRFVALLLVSHMKFMGECEGDEALNVLIAEPGDTLGAIDSELNRQLSTNPYSGKRQGDPGFVPCFETLHEFQTFYEMFFVEGGGELGISLVVPRRPGIDPELLALCALHSRRGQR